MKEPSRERAGRPLALLLLAGALSLSAARGARAEETACAALTTHPEDAGTWVVLGEQLAAGRHLPCRVNLQKRFLGHEEPKALDSPPNPRLVSGVAREALALTWAPALRGRALRLLVNATRPTAEPCAPKEADCLALKGDPKAWWSYQALYAAETGVPPDDAAALRSAAAASARFSGWTAPGTASSEPCDPASARRPAVDTPPTDPAANCGTHGYRVCPVKEKATWVEVAYTPCDGDALANVVYVDENRDGVEDALLWIKYDSYDGEEISGTRTYLEVVDGRTGKIVLHGLVTVTVVGPDGGTFALTVRRPVAGRLELRLPSPSPPALEAHLRRAHPELLAPGSYVLGPSGFHRNSKEDGAPAKADAASHL